LGLHETNSIQEWRRRLLAILIGIGLAAVAGVTCEYTYRLIKLGSFSFPVKTWIADPDLIYELNPQAPDSPQGYRAKAPGTDRDATVRIICMGGSTTYGHGVQAHEAWPWIAEGVLRARGIDAEVINAGVPGYGTHQLLIRYRRDIAAFKSDIVVLFLGWNGVGALVDPYGFVPGSVPRPGASLFRRLWIAVAQHSLMFQDAVHATRDFRVRALDGGYRYYIDRYFDTFILDTKALVDAIHANGQIPVLVIHAALYHPGMSSKELSLVEPKLYHKLPYNPIMLTELERQQTALRSIAQESHLPMIDLEECLRGYRGQERADLFLDEAHLSVKGNLNVGECVGNALSDIIQQSRTPHLVTQPVTTGGP
jgi:lysophospholipase L1-like esterase